MEGILTQFTTPQASELSNESDVEQKLLHPLLVSPAPLGLGFANHQVQTKKNLRRFSIGKGTERKSYFPDYVISLSGVPLIVVEAKTPGADLLEAFREARLYASELNSVYPGGTNPVFRVIATDGLRLLAGPCDQSAPDHDLSLEDISPYSEKMAAFAGACGVEAAKREYDRIVPKFRPKRLWKPRKMVGGTATQREEVGLNTFGATISADFSQIFNPLSREDRAYIAKHGYVPSKRRERYIEPIDRVIRAAAPPSVTRSRIIENTGEPTDLIKTFRTGRRLEHQILLLVGSAGSGKTTFVDYLQEVALPPDVREKTVWIRINMNPAPVSRSEIYDWLRTEIVDGLKLTRKGTDFDDLETIKAIHASEVTAFRKGLGRLYERNRELYDQKLAEVLEKLLQDPHKNALNIARYLAPQSGKLLVIVLDNSDKRLRDEQLLMFEAAQWIQREFGCLVVLPLREETYDNHRDEPPLDTALKDLVFRIEPPLFQNILQNRVQLAMQSINKKGAKTLRYKLPNGINVEYPASDQGYYLSSIMKSIFGHGLHVRRLIVGLSGRNMRRALEIFLEFCTSGHISESEIVKIRHSQGQYVLPMALVTTVLLRLNQRFYSSSHAYLKNVYSVDERDARPQFFTRRLILKSLEARQDVFGPKHLKGYEHVRVLREILSECGVDAEVFERELENLARAFCVVSEDFRVEGLADSDLIALSPAGLVHLQIMDDPYYLSAVAEDTWFYDKDFAESISQRIKSEATHYSPSSTFFNASLLLEALSIVRDNDIRAVASYREPIEFERFTDLTGAWVNLGKYERSIVPAPWYGAHDRYPLGSQHEARIKNKVHFGIFVEMEPGLDALLHSSNLPVDFYQNEIFSVGSNVKVRITELDHINRRMAAMFVSPSSLY